MYTSADSKYIPIVGKHGSKITSLAWSDGNLLACTALDKSVNRSNPSSQFQIQLGIQLRSLMDLRVTLRMSNGYLLKRLHWSLEEIPC